MWAILFIFCVLFAGQKNAAAFFIETPIFLPTGPARINFTRGDGDPARAYFNIAVASNASRLADNVDTSLGFVDVNIGVLPGKYTIFAFGDDSDSGFLGSTGEFAVIQAPSTSESKSSSIASESSSASNTATTSRTATTQESSNTSVTSNSKSSPPIGLIIGPVVGVLALIGMALFIFLYCCQVRRRKRMRDSENVLATAYSTPMEEASNRIDPFTTPSVSSSSLPSSRAVHQRQAYITNEMRLVRKQMEELNHRTAGSISSITNRSVFSSEAPLDSSAADLQRSRQLNDDLQRRIVLLEGQLQSAWAQGLSNDPPPGYIE
ncbi:hypothetical protein C8J57DRAFT_88011 [Mycena rebaudengoi]|nr:hypothetical protein C8J57DRAFT_88011 [Mycena rebaudengoi]